MAKELHHLDKWGYANLDLGKEIIESGQKALILIAGASSSGNLMGQLIYIKCLVDLAIGPALFL